MKKIKHGIMLVVGAACIYAFVSYTIFYYKKSALDVQLPLQIQDVSRVNFLTSLKDSQVDCDEVQEHLYKHPENKRNCMVLDKDHMPFVSIVAEPGHKLSFDLQESDDQASQLSVLDSYSFVTMPAELSLLDAEVMRTLHILIGNDVDEFVRLILQSNNNIVSKQACKSCAMYAFFHKIKKGEQLDKQEIIILQKLLANLYRFIEKMKNFSAHTFLRQEQYDALQDLNSCQAKKNDTNLQARKAAINIALQKLQKISTN